MSEAAAAGLFLGGSLMTVLMVVLGAWLLFIIAYWNVFKKMGEPGWKCIIPIYNEYIIYKRTWSGGMFLAYVISALIGSLCIGMGSTYDAYGNFQEISNPALASAGSILFVATAIISIMQYYYFAKSFGHGIGYMLGLIFLSFIFVLVIGFGSSRYIGPKGISSAAYGNPYNGY